MKLHSINAAGFGALSDLTLEDLEPDLNVLYGSNGSGKTTLVHFVRGILCGFRESRKIGLLPPADGRTGGGSLVADWEEDLCRFTRRDEAGRGDHLRVTLLQDDRQTPHPRFPYDKLRTDLIALLFTAGVSDVHAIDRLIQQAGRDDIQLAGRREDSTQFQRAAGHVDRERSALLRNGGEGRLAELAERRAELKMELERLTGQLRDEGRKRESRRSRQPEGSVVAWRGQVTWLHNELAAAECDLREAEDRRWRSQPAPRTVTVTPAHATTSQKPPKQQRRDHIDVQRLYRLRQLDRRIDQARTLLAEAARARLDLGLRAARIAGSEDTPAEPFLKQVRESLKSLEVGVLELRDEAGQLTGQHKDDRCVCEQWQQATSDAVGEVSRHLYRLCEQVSQYELRHQKSVLAGAKQTIRDAELGLLKHLESLRTQRREILEASGGLHHWQGKAQSAARDLHCECLEHPRRHGWTVPAAAAEPARPQQEVRTFHTIIERPTREQLSLLRQRVERLREELAQATARWRSARNWRPQPELTADVQALERRIDQTKIELNVVETELAEGRKRWQVLSVTGEVLGRIIERIERDRRPTVLQWAGQYLRQLTQGRYGEIDVDDGAVSVVTAEGNRRTRSALSRGTLDQLALSLRLALVRAYASRGVRFPLILDDVLVDTDQQRLQAAVRVLREFARDQDQQIVYLTCQSHLAGLFEQQGTTVRTLPGSDPRTRSTPEQRTKPVETIRGWVDQRQDSEVRPAEPVTVERSIPEPSDGDSGSTSTAQPQRNIRLLEPLHRRQADGPYWLSIDAPVDLIPSVGAQMGRRLVGLGVRTTGELIDLDPERISLRLKSLQITPERLAGWQSEALLLCCVPDLTGPDAQLLVQVGIENVRQLSQARLDDLVLAIDRLSDGERTRLGFTRHPGREVVQRWIHSSRRARRLRNARRFSRRGGRSRQRTRVGVGPQSTQRRLRSSGSRSGGLAVRRRVQSQRRREPRRGSDQDRGAVPKSTPQQPQATVPLTSQSRDSAPAKEWKFYLSLQSPVVDAPSIGPTTANRLSRIGVITVADLLNRPAAEIAKRLKNRRIKEGTVLLWQRQARLMCRIPQLRGHDAQVLIACDITEPEQVASMTPESLFEIVGPFVETTAGQRLLRSSKTPDLEEVTDWVTWARHSRTLRAA